MGKIVNVREIVENKKLELSNRISNLKSKNIFPKLALIVASSDEASKVYIKNKRKLCHELEVLEEEYTFDENVTNDELLDVINKLNADDSVSGILVQLPLYKHLDEGKILDSINPKKDVDGFHHLSLGKLVIGEKTITSCTPKGIMTILDSLDVELSGKNAVIVGRSRIVGKPMAHLLLNRNCTVTVCHSKTKDLKYYTSNADILIVAVGNPNIITSDMVKENSVVIDVGINRLDDGIVGDVDTKSVVDKVKYITPVPGGVGLTTVISLIENLVEIEENNIK